MATQYKLVQELHYGTTTLLTETGAFVDLFQSNYSFPNRVQGLRDIEIKNIGQSAIELDFNINTWTDGTPDADGGYVYLRWMLAVGESMHLPNQKCLGFDLGVGSAADAYVLNNKNPADINSGALFQVSGSTLAAHLDDSDTTVTTQATHPFYVGDLIQIGTDTTTATRQEMMRITAISGATLTVERALYGTSLADKDSQTDATEGAVSGARIHLPFFNTTGESNHYSGLSTASTDENGRFHIYNFFGYGRYTNNVAGGVVPGSVAGKYYSSGYQNLGLSGITSSTNSGLTASGEYKLDITVDGGTLFQDLTFTLGSNVNFGGAGGVIAKIQEALDTQFYTAGNLFEKRVTVGIINGDVRFTSGSRLSTSAILLADTGDSGSFIDATANGRIPASGNIPSAVSSVLGSDIIVDKITGKQSRNSSIFFYDDANGNIKGASTTGTINYETGEFSIQGVANANFVITANYGAALAGGTRSTSAGDMNSIGSIGARSMNHKIDGLIEFTAYE